MTADVSTDPWTAGIAWLFDPSIGRIFGDEPREDC